jgi:hypothetical protein
MLRPVSVVDTGCFQSIFDCPLTVVLQVPVTSHAVRKVLP